MSTDDTARSGERAACDERCATGPGWFWTRSEWAEWSNKIAMLLPEEYDGDEAQESIILRAVADMTVCLTDQRFTAEEVIKIANETSDSLGNLYRLDFIDRIRHEADMSTLPAEPTSQPIDGADQ